MISRGRVYFVGAGPGHPELITVRGQRLLAEADVVVYADSLVSRELLGWARPGARVIGSAGLTLEEIVAELVAGVRAGGLVVRLHTGDPSLYGAILEQMVLLNRAGIPYEVVPGVSAVFAAAAGLGVELTVPEVAQTLILSRVEGRTPVPERERLRELAAHRTTLALYLSAGRIEHVVQELQAGGYAADTPAAVVQRASWPDQRVIRGTLADIAAQTRAAGVTQHALIMVGQALDPDLPLGGAQRSRLYAGEFGHGYRRASAGAAASGGAAAGAADVVDAGGAASGGAAAGVADATSGGPAGAAGGGYAVVAITRAGAALAGRVLGALPGADLWVSERWADEAAAAGGGVAAGDGGMAGAGGVAGRIIPFAGSPGPRMGDWFARYAGLVCCFSLGAAVRMMAPHLRHKHTDPAVVVLDEHGQYAVPVVGGHLGGANALARRLAGALGGRPVITTASDVQGTLAVDLLGRDLGWRIEGWENVTAASAAVVNGEPVAVYQDAGEPDWWPGGPLPPGIRPVGSLDECAAFIAALVVTDRAEVPAAVAAKAVLYRPRSLVVGVGCNRDTPAAEIAHAVGETLAAHGLSPLAVRNWASIDVKADEAGLLAAARQAGARLEFFPADRLDAVAAPNPSATVQRHVGARGVAEPAALLSAGDGAELAVPKQRRGNCTVAVARVRRRGE